MKHIVTATLTASALLLAVVPAIGGGGVGAIGGHGSRVLVAPQQTVVVSPHEAVITPRPFLVVQREAVPGTFAAFRGFHQHFGHIIVFVDPKTGLVWPSGFLAWSGTEWVWIPQGVRELLRR